MGYLSEALGKYCTKKGKNIVFLNGETLSSLALQMWEYLGFQKVDASVVSRVLKGERLFTPSQLQAFCSLLSLSKAQEEYLFSCLTKDYFQRDNISLITPDATTHTLLSVFEPLVKHSATLFYEGQSSQVISQTDSIETIYETLSHNNFSSPFAYHFFELYGYFLFLKERSIAGVYSPQSATQSILSTSAKLHTLGKENKIKNLYAYNQILLADVEYMFGLYSTPQEDKVHFEKSLTLAHKAFKTLDDTHREKFAALRLMAVNACYLRDLEAIIYIEKKMLSLLPLQPIENIINTMHLSKMITKGRVLLEHADPFGIEEKVLDYYHNVPHNDGMYFELSDLKTRLETFALLKVKDRNILLPLIERGMNIVNHGQFPRHKLFFENQLQKYS